jgi:hypothetical protein
MAACYIVAGDVMTDQRFPLSRSGWTAARAAVYRAQARSAGFATLMCPPNGGIPLYQCYKGQSCTIESSDGNTVLAGGRRRKRRRR